jgi:hypothetical protein
VNTPANSFHGWELGGKMKITKSQLKKIIKEELEATLKERWWDKLKQATMRKPGTEPTIGLQPGYKSRRLRRRREKHARAKQRAAPAAAAQEEETEETSSEMEEELMKELAGSFGGGLAGSLGAKRPEKDEPFHDLGPDVQRLYAEWMPETDEGKLYKNQLGGLIGREETEETEEPLDEKKLTDAEKKKKEQLAKKDKPALKKMQDQYGKKKGKDVYYGWVTKRAKKEA